MIFKKRAISPLIATVMLIGFSVAMAAIVSTFIIKQTRDNFNPENLIEDSSLCDQMVLAAVVPEDSKLQIKPGSPARLQGIMIQNRGAYALRGLVASPVGANYEIPYIFDNRVGTLANNTLLYGELESGGEGQQYIAPGKKYAFGYGSGNWANDVGIALPSSYASCETQNNCKIKVYPIIWDFEKEKAVKCIKSVLEFDYSEICKNYGHQQIKDNGNCQPLTT